MRRYVLAAAFAYLAFSGVAVAAQPCGTAVIDDWHDNGALDQAWNCECLRDAISRLPGIRPPYVATDGEFQRQNQVQLRRCDGSSIGSSDHLTDQEARNATLVPLVADDEDSGGRWPLPLVAVLAIAMTAAVTWWALRRRQREA
jgi:hypothetical protein